MEIAGAYLVILENRGLNFLQLTQFPQRNKFLKEIMKIE
jgi:hypothetical protein